MVQILQPVSYLCGSKLTRRLNGYLRCSCRPKMRGVNIDITVLVTLSSLFTASMPFKQRWVDKINAVEVCCHASMLSSFLLMLLQCEPVCDLAVCNRVITTFTTSTVLWPWLTLSASAASCVTFFLWLWTGMTGICKLLDVFQSNSLTSISFVVFLFCNLINFTDLSQLAIIFALWLLEFFAGDLLQVWVIRGTAPFPTNLYFGTSVATLSCSWMYWLGYLPLGSIQSFRSRRSNEPCNGK